MPKHILYIAYRQNIQQTLSAVLNFKSYRLWQNPMSLAHPGMSWNESNITGFLQEPTPNSSKPISDSHSELAWTWEHRFRHWLTRDFSSTLVLLHSGGVWVWGIRHAHWIQTWPVQVPMSLPGGLPCPVRPQTHPGNPIDRRSEEGHICTE